MELPSLLPALLDSVCLYSGEILAQISSSVLDLGTPGSIWNHGRSQGGGGWHRLAEALPFPGDTAFPLPPAGQQDKGAAG